MIPVVRPAAAEDIGTPVHGRFWATCYYDHSAEDDPIMFPRQPGASHLHDFFGNASANANSSAASMSKAGSRCVIRGDRSGYWAPAGFLDDIRLPGMEVHTYYTNMYAHDEVRPVPPGLRMIGGSARAQSEAENPHVFWSCGATSPKRPHPYECSGFGDRHVVGGIDFPSCWDGTGTGMDDVAYPATPGQPCPSEFPVELPLLSLRVVYGTGDPCAGTIPCGPWDPDVDVHLRLASGPYYTLHADFWNFWAPAGFGDLLEHCLNAHVDCKGLAPRPAVPRAPVLAAHRAAAGRIRLAWTPPDTCGSDLTAYRIYRSTLPAAQNAYGRGPIAVIRSGQSFVDFGLAHGVRYFYRVEAVNGIGAGGLSNEASVATT
jgi:hypothetical protein